jgi:hypothetical protein
MQHARGQRAAAAPIASGGVCHSQGALAARRAAGAGTRAQGPAARRAGGRARGGRRRAGGARTSMARMSTRAWPWRRALCRVATSGTSASCGPNTRSTAAATGLPCGGRPASQRRRAASAGPTLVTQPPHAPPRFPMPARDRQVLKTRRVDGKPPARCCWGALRLAGQRRQRTGTWRGSALTVNRPLSSGCARRHRRRCASTLQDPLRPARRAARVLSRQRATAR